MNSVWTPKDVSLDALKNEIIKPGIEKHLEPLVHFKGRMDIGRYHRYFNLAVLMMMAECETLSHGVKIALDPEFAHLCGPEKKPEHMSLRSFFSRLRLKPQVADNVQGLKEYSEFICPIPFRLTPVPKEAERRDRMAWWRVCKGRSGKGPLRSVSESLIYPFLVHEPKNPDEGYDLTKFVNDSVPKTLPPDVRADLCQDMIVALLSGEITRDQVAGSVKEFTRKAFRAAPQKYGHVSFDAPLPGYDGRTLADVLH